MDIDVSKILEALKRIEPLLILLVPAVLGIWFRVGAIIKKKKNQIMAQRVAKQKEIFQQWIHRESRKTIVKIADICNVYRDRSGCDQVLFLQFENGTTATNQLCNMYISCLAEDDRYGTIPRKCLKIQRIPYGELVGWLKMCASTQDATLLIEDTQKLQDKVDITSTFFDGVGSSMSEGVYDSYRNLIGFVVFNYIEPNFDECDVSEDAHTLDQCRIAMETVFLSFHISREKKEMDMLKFEAGN